MLGIAREAVGLQFVWYQKALHNWEACRKLGRPLFTTPVLGPEGWWATGHTGPRNQINKRNLTVYGGDSSPGSVIRSHVRRDVRQLLRRLWAWRPEPQAGRSGSASPSCSLGMSSSHPLPWAACLTVTSTCFLILLPLLTHQY